VEKDKIRIAFNDIKEFLEKHFPDNYSESEEYEECYHISVYSQESENSVVWFEFDIGSSELIVGYGISHIHYGKQYGVEIKEGINRLIDFFNVKMRRTDYYKGETIFKNVYEIKKENREYEYFGTSSMFLLYPFWKRAFWGETTKKVNEFSELIKDKNIKAELEKVREQINNVC
jgi:hypothetical protein